MANEDYPIYRQNVEIIRSVTTEAKSQDQQLQNEAENTKMDSGSCFVVNVDSGFTTEDLCQNIFLFFTAQISA